MALIKVLQKTFYKKHFPNTMCFREHHSLFYACSNCIIKVQNNSYNWMKFEILLLDFSQHSCVIYIISYDHIYPSLLKSNVPQEFADVIV